MADNSEKLLAMCKEKYPDPAVAELVHADAVAHGTVDMILDGRSVLPHPKDAKRHHDRVTGKDPQTRKETAMANTIAELEQRITALETPAQPPAPKPQGV